MKLISVDAYGDGRKARVVKISQRRAAIYVRIEIKIPRLRAYVRFYLKLCVYMHIKTMLRDIVVRRIPIFGIYRTRTVLWIHFISSDARGYNILFLHIFVRFIITSSRIVIIIHRTELCSISMSLKIEFRRVFINNLTFTVFIVIVFNNTYDRIYKGKL